MLSVERHAREPLVLNKTNIPGCGIVFPVRSLIPASAGAVCRGPPVPGKLSDQNPGKEGW